MLKQEIYFMDEQLTNLQQLHKIMSVWTKNSNDCFQYFVESMPLRIKIFF